MPGCREVVTDGETGLLVPPRDGEALATAIARVAYNPDLAWRLGQAARKRALAEFDQEIIVNRTLEVYREVL